jgi:hypothetical protein
MSFFKFAPEDIINTKIIAYPQSKTFLAGDQMTRKCLFGEKILRFFFVEQKISRLL